jgi:hypothetical protein
MLVEDNRVAYRKLRGEIGEWLERNHILNAMPELLPSELYADASHPLTQGYRMLAERIHADPKFRSWLK